VKDLADWYNKELTNASFKELINFIKWCNKIYGYHPVIVGGWAVWHYAKHAKSRDIDVIMPTNKSIHQLLLHYYKARNFKSYGFMVKQYFKEITVKNKKEKIYLDASSYERKNRLKEDPQIEMSWNLLEKNSIEWKTKNFTARVPTKEFLLVMKVKALRDRLFELKEEKIDEEIKSFLEAKVEKDENDIKQLMKTKIRQEKLEKLLKKTKFKKYFDQTIKELKINSE